MLALQEIPGVYARKHTPLPIATLNQMIKTAQDERILPIEKDMLGTSIENEVQKLKNEITVATRGLDVEFPRINMDFMKLNKKKWCDVSGRVFPRKLYVPQFSFFSAFSPNAAIELTLRKDTHNKYYDFKPITSRLAQLGGSVIFKDKFTGAIPLPTKTKILANKDRFDSILLVKEANWDVEMILPRYLDPLVIGNVGHIHFLIDMFDLTSVEKYIADTFTSTQRT